jgi:hypothetical protein
LTEGSTESYLFAYLTKVRFRNLFANASIQFSNKVEIAEQNISEGNLNGVSNLKTFKQKYNRIKKKYSGQPRFFLLDKDIPDSTEIEKLIVQNKDIVQFVNFNSEYTLLKLARKRPKHPDNFKNLTDFRSYCKSEFIKEFKKKASELNDRDFDNIFGKVKDEEIEEYFSVLFKLIK